MKTYRNLNFTKRNYECSNVVACQTALVPGADGRLPGSTAVWQESHESILNGLESLWLQSDVRYYGWL